MLPVWNSKVWSTHLPGLSIRPPRACWQQSKRYSCSASWLNIHLSLLKFTASETHGDPQQEANTVLLLHLSVSLTTSTLFKLTAPQWVKATNLPEPAMCEGWGKGHPARRSNSHPPACWFDPGTLPHISSDGLLPTSVWPRNDARVNTVQE